MTDRRDRTSSARRPRERSFRRALPWGLAASAALHLAVVLLWPAGPPTASPGDQARRASPEIRRGIQAVDVRPAPRSAADRRRIAAEVPTPSHRERSLLQMEPVPVERPTPRWAPSGEARRGGESGSGPGAAGGGSADGGFTPPVPRSLLPDWSPPEEVRGHRVTVRVEVDERGRPTGRVELAPPTPSESFNRELRRRMKQLEFVPARRDGRPVTAWAEITFTFGKGPEDLRAPGLIGG